jgi:hypothetical protein
LRTAPVCVRSGKTEQRIALRARIILGAADGKSNNALARELNTTRRIRGSGRRRQRRQAGRRDDRAFHPPTRGDRQGNRRDDRPGHRTARQTGAATQRHRGRRDAGRLADRGDAGAGGLRRSGEMVAYAGLNPSHHRFGSSIDRPTRISKIGNATLRSSLYSGAGRSGRIAAAAVSATAPRSDVPGVVQCQRHPRGCDGRSPPCRHGLVCCP